MNGSSVPLIAACTMGRVPSIVTGSSPMRPALQGSRAVAMAAVKSVGSARAANQDNAGERVGIGLDRVLGHIVGRTIPSRRAARPAPPQGWSRISLMRVLAIESSCDESAAAVLDADAGLLAHELYSQVELHRIHGGVVPELASRDHVRKLLPLVKAALARSATRPQDLGGIAYTAGPGLIGALLTGAALASSLAYAWKLPALGVHHLEGHLLAPLLEPDPPPFPHLALLVSGGHTMLIEVAAIGHYRVLGETRDDAAGEAFDKTAKLLGLPYPGGPQLAALATRGTPGAFQFPRPMLDRPGLELSFSGLKTAVLHSLRGRELT